MDNGAVDRSELEYATLRSEILQNDRTIQVLLVLGFLVVNAFLLASFAEQARAMAAFALLAYLLFSQMVAHKAEGTVRIATYIAAFLEPKLGGCGWERRLRSIDARLWTLDASQVLAWNTALGLLAAWKDKGLLPAVAVVALAFFQKQSLRRLNSPEGFAAQWRAVLERERSES
ncbi:MAG: hypothetical protein ACK41F_08205 [Fimbriimonadaceae bacterium]